MGNELVEMSHAEWREWFYGVMGRYPTILDTYRMQVRTGESE